jgi:hypothetical protein
MSLTPGALTYVADSFDQNRVGYAGPNQSPTAKDTIILSRVAPKPTAVYSGNQRYTWKSVQTATLVGALTGFGDVIFELSVSIPVGTPGATITTLVDGFQAQVAEADFQTFLETTKISF